MARLRRHRVLHGGKRILIGGTGLLVLPKNVRKQGVAGHVVWGGFGERPRAAGRSLDGADIQLRWLRRPEAHSLWRVRSCSNQAHRRACRAGATPRPALSMSARGRIQLQRFAQRACTLKIVSSRRDEALARSARGSFGLIRSAFGGVERLFVLVQSHKGEAEIDPYIAAQWRNGSALVRGAARACSPMRTLGSVIIQQVGMIGRGAQCARTLRRAAMIAGVSLSASRCASGDAGASRNGARDGGGGVELPTLKRPKAPCKRAASVALSAARLQNRSSFP